MRRMAGAAVFPVVLAVSAATSPAAVQSRTDVRIIEVPAPGGQTTVIKVLTGPEQPPDPPAEDSAKAAGVPAGDGNDATGPGPEITASAETQDDPEPLSASSEHRPRVSGVPRPEPENAAVPEAVTASAPADVLPVPVAAEEVLRPERSQAASRGSARCREHWNELLEPLKDARFTLRVPAAQRRKVHLGPQSHLLYDDDTLFYVEEPEDVRITRVRVNRRRGRCQSAEIHLRSAADRDRRGKLTFVTGRVPSEHDFYLWLDQPLAVDTPAGALKRYAVNHASRTVHLATSTHLPAGAEAVSEVPKGMRLCPVCFGVPSLATLAPMPESLAEPYAADVRLEVPGSEDEFALAAAGWRQVQSFPPYSGPYQEIVERVGNRVLSEWPGLLKGYDYRFLVVDAPMVNAMAVPMGGVVVTKRLMDALETEAELAALLAHEIAHVEARHSYRHLRNARNAAGWAALGAALANSFDPNCRNYGLCLGDSVGQIGTVIAQNFLQGHGRDREQEADIFASFYLGSTGMGREPLVSLLSKLQFENEYLDPEGKNQGRTHPHIASRVAWARNADVRPFGDVTAFRGLNRDGDVVATLALEFQVVGYGILRIIASLDTTPLLDRDDNVNDLELVIGGEEIRFLEATAERVAPGERTTAMFEAPGMGLVNEAVTGMKLKLRNVREWVPVGPASLRSAKGQG